MTQDGDPRTRPPEPSLDPRLRVAIAAVGTSGAALAAAGALLFGLRTGTSVAAGAAMATGNLWALSRVVAALLPEGPSADGNGGADGPPRGGAWTFVGLTKTIGLLLAAWLVLSYRVASPLPMLVGFGALPMGIAIGALVSDRRPQAKSTP